MTNDELYEKLRICNDCNMRPLCPILSIKISKIFAILTKRGVTPDEFDKGLDGNKDKKDFHTIEIS